MFIPILSGYANDRRRDDLTTVGRAAPGSDATREIIGRVVQRKSTSNATVAARCQAIPEGCQDVVRGELMEERTPNESSPFLRNTRLPKMRWGGAGGGRHTSNSTSGSKGEPAAVLKSPHEGVRLGADLHPEEAIEAAPSSPNHSVANVHFQEPFASHRSLIGRQTAARGPDAADPHQPRLVQDGGDSITQFEEDVRFSTKLPVKNTSP